MAGNQRPVKVSIGGNCPGRVTGFQELFREIESISFDLFDKMEWLSPEIPPLEPA